MTENKADFIRAIGEALADYSRESVAKVEYLEESGREIARITFLDGSVKNVGVTYDSCIAVMHDIYRALL